MILLWITGWAILFEAQQLMLEELYGLSRPS